MGDIAECIITGSQSHVGRDVDAPVGDVLAIVIARRQPEHLNYTCSGWIVTIDQTVGDAQAHVRNW